jgi:magnesium-transporting ATPase (P-type)
MSQIQRRDMSNTKERRISPVNNPFCILGPFASLFTDCTHPFNKDLSSLEWHTLTASEVCTRLGVSPTLGLDAPMVARRLAKYGKNVISHPPKHLAKKIFFYIFGGENLTWESV